MNPFRNHSRAALLGLLIVSVWVCGLAAADVEGAPGAPADGDGGRKSLLDFVRAGGIVGYVIIALSAAGVALVIDAAVHLKADKLIPPSLAAEAERLARGGRFGELRTLCQASDSVAARVLRSGLGQGQLGVEAVREAIREQGTREVTRLQQRVGYIGLIASVAPMLGLLGTVVGMIGSFDVLGTGKGASRPDELAVGISKALVTTCMGLVVAVPLIFLHSYFRDRVTRIAQELSALCERVLRITTAIVELRNAAGRDARAAAPAEAPVEALDRAIESALEPDGDEDA
jgi:biopolymer transport protein ExbB